jgi:glutamine synthetase
MTTIVLSENILSVKMEYLWIDAFDTIRSKTKVKMFNSTDFKKLPSEFGEVGSVEFDKNLIPEWYFDGSSTNQSCEQNSDVILKPKFICLDPFNESNNISFLVLCDTYNSNDTPHKTNKRVECSIIEEQSTRQNPLFGISQEYIICFLDSSIGNNFYQYAKNESPYYCGIGSNKIAIRNIMNDHLTKCLKAGLHFRGMNTGIEANKGEFQLGELSMTLIGDELWVARYILIRVCELYNAYPVFESKDIEKYEKYDISKGYVNFSTNKMRSENGFDNIIETCEKLKLKHKEYLDICGIESTNTNCGIENTNSHCENFNFGVSNRTTSVRIPFNAEKNKKGYLEDRRAPANMNPYVVTSIIVKTTCL